MISSWLLHAVSVYICYLLLLFINSYIIVCAAACDAVMRLSDLCLIYKISHRRLMYKSYTIITGELVTEMWFFSDNLITYLKILCRTCLCAGVFQLGFRRTKVFRQWHARVLPNWIEKRELNDICSHCIHVFWTLCVSKMHLHSGHHPNPAVEASALPKSPCWCVGGSLPLPKNSFLKTYFWYAHGFHEQSELLQWVHLQIKVWKNTVLCCWVLGDEKLVLQQSVTDLNNSLRGMETSRLEAERHRLELEHNLNSAETERNLLTVSVSDLQTTLTKADDKQEQLRQEIIGLKQKVVC